MDLAVPPGPARMRAGTHDRERTAALIRSNWEAERLTDEELDQRLGKALAARTLGDLRDLIGDLPEPPLSRAQRARRALVYAGRGARHVVRTPVRAVSAFVVSVVVLGTAAGAVSGPHNLASGSAPPPLVNPAPQDGVGAGSAVPQASGPLRLIHVKLGEVGRVGGLALRVERVRTTGSVPLNNGGLLPAGPHKRLVMADVEITNELSQPVDPFCAEGAELFVRNGTRYGQISQNYSVAGNTAMCTPLAIESGQRAVLHLVFGVPAGERPAHLELWNAATNSSDLLGAHERVRVDF